MRGRARLTPMRHEEQCSGVRALVRRANSSLARLRTHLTEPREPRLYGRNLPRNWLNGFDNDVRKIRISVLDLQLVTVQGWG